jgi:hypothetical protein
MTDNVSSRNRATSATTAVAVAVADDLLVLPDDNFVMTFAQWCAAASIGQRTGRRILSAPGGPVVTQLGPRRIGITRRNHRLWLASRARA